MIRTKEEHLNLLEETIEYYKTHKRGFNEKNEKCFYYLNKDAMCAVGRCMKNPSIFKDFRGDVYKLDEEEGIESLLKDKYKGYSIFFWKQLQRFHDINSFWNPTENGQVLSNEGEYKKKGLINWINLNYD